MFNDILTGKETLQQEPVATNPYRPDPGPSDLVCTHCARTFPARQAMAGRCRECAPTALAALNAMRGPKADYTDYSGNERKRDFGLALIMTCVLAAVVVGGFFLRAKLRQQASDDIEIKIGGNGNRNIGIVPTGD